MLVAETEELRGLSFNTRLNEILGVHLKELPSRINILRSVCFSSKFLRGNLRPGGPTLLSKYSRLWRQILKVAVNNKLELFAEKYKIFPIKQHEQGAERCDEKEDKILTHLGRVRADHNEWKLPVAGGSLVQTGGES